MACQMVKETSGERWSNQGRKRQSKRRRRRKKTIWYFYCNNITVKISDRLTYYVTVQLDCNSNNDAISAISLLFDPWKLCRDLAQFELNRWTTMCCCIYLFLFCFFLLFFSIYVNTIVVHNIHIFPLMYYSLCTLCIKNNYNKKQEKWKNVYSISHS